MMMQHDMKYKVESKAEEFIVSVFEQKWKLVCKRQLPIHGKIPDVIAYSKKNDKLFAVEVKIRNWKRGIYQAFNNKNIVDYSLLCMPKDSYQFVKSKISDDLTITGIGFLEFDVTKKEILIKKIPEKNSIDFNRKENLKKILLKPEGEK